jgi:hypothetical protein
LAERAILPGAEGVGGNPQLGGDSVEGTTALEEEVDGLLAEGRFVGAMGLGHGWSSFWITYALPVHQIGGTSDSGLLIPWK